MRLHERVIICEECGCDSVCGVLCVTVTACVGVFVFYRHITLRVHMRLSLSGRAGLIRVCSVPWGLCLGDRLTSERNQSV